MPVICSRIASELMTVKLASHLKTYFSAHVDLPLPGMPMSMMKSGSSSLCLGAELLDSFLLLLDEERLEDDEPDLLEEDLMRFGELVGLPKYVLYTRYTKMLTTTEMAARTSFLTICIEFGSTVL